jgi:hypothetical protein
MNERLILKLIFTQEKHLRKLEGVGPSDYKNVSLKGLFDICGYYPLVMKRL